MNVLIPLWKVKYSRKILFTFANEKQFFKSKTFHKISINPTLYNIKFPC